jgi:protein involved in polysaccharide export with SLBB domain
MTVEQAKDLINSQISKYLRNYDLGLQLLRARRITVYLLGQVRQPGSYIAIAGTSALGVIQTAGTLVVNPVTVNINEPAMMHPYFRALTSGAGRRVQIWRNNQMVTELDLAAMAISGKMGDDIILEDGDALFVPPNQKPVVVRGGVSRPGTYEVAPDDTVFDILAQAGGYKSMMMLGSVEVERPNPSGEPGSKITELDLRNPSFDPHSFAFQSGDILRVPETKSKVYVMGAVWLPQAVDFHEGWNALDYIAAANGVVAPADTAGIRIISFPLTDQMSSFRFNFKNLILGKPVQTVPIEPGDLIYVPWKNQQWVGPGLIGGIATVMAQISGFARLIHDIKIHVG